MAKRNSNKKMVIREGMIKASTPRSIWAMEQASICYRPKPKDKVIETRTRRDGQAQCDRRNW